MPYMNAASSTSTAENRRGSEAASAFVDLLLLSLLSNGPRHGFGLVVELDEAGLLPEGQGSIYPVLSRMEREGLLDSFMQEVADKDRRRKYYRLTSDGARVLGQLQAQWRAFSDGVEGLLQRPGE